MVPVEVCINCDSQQSVGQSVGAAYHGGASSVELCSAMHCQGLTPTPEHIVEARAAFQKRVGLFVMIRPREGTFCYTEPELDTMCRQIVMAAEAGADGVVFGVLRQQDGRLAVDALQRLVKTGRAHQLKVTFHRAFDALPDPLDALDVLADAGIDRILTSGTAWDSSESAVDGVGSLRRICERAGDRVEIVIGGGVNSGNIKHILQRLPLTGHRISIHAYSGAQENSLTTAAAVQSLVRAAQEVSPRA